MSSPDPDGILEQLGLDPQNLPEDAPKVPPQHVALLLKNIGGVLHQSESFRALPAEQREQILANTERIAAALAQDPDVPKPEASGAAAPAPKRSAPQPSAGRPHPTASTPNHPSHDPFAF